jgi:hypothetical protein
MPPPIRRHTYNSSYSSTHVYSELWGRSITKNSRHSVAHIMQASFSLECSSLPPTRTFLALVVVPFALELAVPVPGAGGGPAEMKTSTIHSYHTLRSSVLRHIVTRSSDASGTVSGTCGWGVVLVSGIVWNCVGRVECYVMIAVGMEMKGDEMEWDWSVRRRGIYSVEWGRMWIVPVSWRQM